MAGRFNFEKESEEVFDFVCGPCNLDGDILQAKGYCSDCQDYLCDFCMKQHLYPKPMRHHVLLDEKSMPKDKKATPTNLKASDTSTERCPKHSGNIIEYYCQSHDFLGCTKCFIYDNHSMCKGVVCIEDATAGLYESQEYKTYTSKIGQIVKLLPKSSSIQQENDELIMMYSIRAKREIRSFRTSINESLDKLENEMDKQVLQMDDLLTSTYLSTFQQLCQLEEDIKTIKLTDEKTKHSRQKRNSYINMKRNQHQLKQLENLVAKINRDIKVSEYNFKPDASLQNIIKDMKTFGKLVTSKEADEAGYLGSTPSTTPTRKIALNPSNTPTQRDKRDVITALKQQLVHYTHLKKLNSQLGIVSYHDVCDHYEDAIESVKAGRRVQFDRLLTTRNIGPLPKQLCDAYNHLCGN